MITTKRRETRQERLNIRATVEIKTLIAKAAEKENKNLSDFVLERALAAAESVLMDDANFNVDKKRWKSFIAALDSPPRDIPALRKLLTEPSIFDEK